MDCRRFKKQVEFLLKKNRKVRLDNSLQQHLHACSKCREKYTPVLDNDSAERVVPQPPKMHGSVSPDKAAPDQVSDPIEFKDAPISFTLHLNGRKESIKLVEPEMDVSLPENGKLVVKEYGIVWCDMRFAFNPQSDRPYELRFRVLMGITYTADHLMAIGSPLEEDEDLLSLYKVEIVDRDDLKAWINMTQGKARLSIKYREQIQ